jgi:hypothetical protein
LGIRIGKLKGTHLIWEPIAVGWPRIAGKTMTPYGVCEVRIDWNKKKFEITLPPQVTAEIRLPHNDGERVKLRNSTSQPKMWSL